LFNSRSIKLLYHPVAKKLKLAVELSITSEKILENFGL